MSSPREFAIRFIKAMPHLRPGARVSDVSMGDAAKLTAAQVEKAIRYAVYEGWLRESSNGGWIITEKGQGVREYAAQSEQEQPAEKKEKEKETSMIKRITDWLTSLKGLVAAATALIAAFVAFSGQLDKLWPDSPAPNSVEALGDSVWIPPVLPDPLTKQFQAFSPKLVIQYQTLPPTARLEIRCGFKPPKGNDGACSSGVFNTTDGTAVVLTDAIPEGLFKLAVSGTADTSEVHILVNGASFGRVVLGAAGQGFDMKFAVSKDRAFAFANVDPRGVYKAR